MIRLLAWSFLLFCLGGAPLLPQFFPQVVLPDELVLYSPFAIMGLAMLIKVEGALFLKERSQMYAIGRELKELSKKLGEQEEAYQSLEKKWEVTKKDLSKSRSLVKDREYEIKSQEKTYKRDKADWQRALDDSLKKISSLKQEVQEAAKKSQSRGDVLTFLGLLQEKGRFVDFLQDDITPYSDEQVGAAARVVHQGCSQVTGEYLEIVPVKKEGEGEVVPLDQKTLGQDYRILGESRDSLPEQGKILHRGWKTQKVDLPKYNHLSGAGLSSIISPAEVEALN